MNMNYSKHYDLLIERAKFRTIPKHIYKEIHHVIPTCLGGKDISENRVKLFAREHYLAHLLLVKIYPDVEKLRYACFRMTSKLNHAEINLLSNKPYAKRLYHRSKNRTYEWLKKNNLKCKHILITDGKNTKWHDVKNEMPTGWQRGLPEEQIENRKGRIKITDGLNESSVKNSKDIPKGWWIGTPLKGKARWITNGAADKFGIFEQLPAGWEHGRKAALLSKGRRFITDGKNMKQIKNHETMPAGWHYGFIKKGVGTKIWITTGKQTKLHIKEDPIPEGWFKGCPFAALSEGGHKKRKNK